MPVSLSIEDLDPDVEPTLAALADRLPDFAPRAAFPEVYAVFRTIRGTPGRNKFYALLASLDGSLVGDDLVLNITRDDRPSRREVILRPRLAAPAQRAFLRRFQAAGGRPPRQMTYLAAHSLVRRERGPASRFACEECDAPFADEWAYSGGSIFEQADEHDVWSPLPADYDALCIGCHRERDALGVDGGVFIPAPSRARVIPVRPRLPEDAPSWVPGPRSADEHLAAIYASLRPAGDAGTASP